MSEIFELTVRPEKDLFFQSRDRHDICLGGIVSTETSDYQTSEIVILGCPQDEGVCRRNGREGAKLAPDAIRQDFYKLSTYGISRKIFDLGNIASRRDLEETNEILSKVAQQILKDGKRLIVLGGGGDIAYADGRAMANAFGTDRWIAINVDARFDIRLDVSFNNETQFRQLLEEKLLLPEYFYEIGFQSYFVSPVYYRTLQNLGVKMISLEQLRSREKADTELREIIRQEFIHHSRTMNVFFSFDLQAVRASDAPGVTESSPFGLRSGEFLTLVEFASKLVNTKIVEFTEVNPLFDVDRRTTRLVAIALHRFCSNF
jgi:formimidoylglutamase